MHRRSLERFAFDSVLLPYSHVITRDEPTRPTSERLLAPATSALAVQTIKGISRGPWGSKQYLRTWYEPLVDQRRSISPCTGCWASRGCS